MTFGLSLKQLNSNLRGLSLDGDINYGYVETVETTTVYGEPSDALYFTRLSERVNKYPVGTRNKLLTHIDAYQDMLVFYSSLSLGVNIPDWYPEAPILLRKICTNAYTKYSNSYDPFTFTYHFTVDPVNGDFTLGEKYTPDNLGTYSPTGVTKRTVANSAFDYFIEGEAWLYNAKWLEFEPSYLSYPENVESGYGLQVYASDGSGRVIFQAGSKFLNRFKSLNLILKAGTYTYPALPELVGHTDEVATIKNRPHNPFRDYPEDQVPHTYGSMGAYASVSNLSEAVYKIKICELSEIPAGYQIHVMHEGGMQYVPNFSYTHYKHYGPDRNNTFTNTLQSKHPFKLAVKDNYLYVTVQNKQWLFNDGQNQYSTVNEKFIISSNQTLPVPLFLAQI